MKRSEIVRKFLKEGYQLDDSSLSFFSNNPEKIQEFLSLLKKAKKRCTVITPEIINEILGLEKGLKIIKTFRTRKEKKTVDDYINFLTTRYEKIKDILISRMRLVNPISINRISHKLRKFSLIVMIRDVDRDGKRIIVEDPTGSTHVVSRDVDGFELLVADEVVGLVCELLDNSVVLKKIIWPDIPIRRKVEKTTESIRCLFISDFHLERVGLGYKYFKSFIKWLNSIKPDENFYTFILGDISSSRKNFESLIDVLPENTYIILSKHDYRITSGNILPDPVFIQINGVKIFLTHGYLFERYEKMWNLPPDRIIISLLKKRHLNPMIDVQSLDIEDSLFLDIIPDIIVCGHFHTPTQSNYKGTTILSTGSFVTQPVFWLVNLKTREVFKIDFTKI